MSAITIEDLPPELLIKVFEFLSPEELLIVQDVCIKWREFARTSLLWEDFVYSPDEGTSDEDMIKFLEKCPMVKHIRTEVIPDKDKFLPAVIKNCFDIHTFHVQFMPTLDVSEIDALFEAFQNLHSFQIRVESPNATQIVDRVSKCTKLKKLILSGQYCCNGVFKPIVDGCVSLEYWSFGGGSPTVSREDLLYVLQNMNEKLLYLQFRFSPTTQQIVNLLSTFTKLESLELHDATHGKVVDFVPLTRIKTLRRLKLESFASETSDLSKFLDFLFVDPFPLLENLDICVFHCKYDNIILKNMCQSYPNIKYLSLYAGHPDDIKDGFKSICQLDRLESLEFSRSFTITDDDIVHVSQCRKLKNLNLWYNRLLTDKTLDHLAKCNTLERLNLDNTSISGQNLHLIAENLKRLNFLSVQQCNNLEKKNVCELADRMPALKILRDRSFCDD